VAWEVFAREAGCIEEWAASDSFLYDSDLVKHLYRDYPLEPPPKIIACVQFGPILFIILRE
jgi:hypothetical protein